jgi:hypothetical protein
MFRSDRQPCMDGASEMRAPLAMIRGAIAEGLYRNRVPLPDNLRLTAPEAGAVRTLSQAARCYTAGHWREVATMVTTTVPGSQEEYRSLVAIMPGFLQCVPAAARGRRFLPTQIRFNLAEALLKMQRPAAPAPAVGGQR